MSDERQTAIRDLTLLAVLGIVVLFTNLGGPRLWDRDEPRNAGCAAEMAARGDWVVPWFNDELRSHKPVLLYWLILSAYSIFGVNEFAARFWSAALGIGTVGLTYLMGRRLFDARVGFWAGLVLLTTLMFDVASRAATPDAALLFCVTLALTLYVLGEFPARRSVDGNEPAETRDWRLAIRGKTALATYAAMGLAVLAKGPVGAVLPTAIIGMFLLIQRLPESARAAVVGTTGSGEEASARERVAQGWGARLFRLFVACIRPFEPRHFLRTCWAMRPLTAVLLILAVAAPWYLWVGLRTDGEFLVGFFWQHNVARAVQSFEGHRGGPWFYPVAICIGFFPWSVFATPLGFDLVRRWRTDLAARPGLVFVLCWAGVWIGVFSIAKTKLPSYVTPSYPALALLVGSYLVRWREGVALVSDRLSRVPLVVLGTAGVAMAVALPIAAHRYLPGAEWLGVIGVVPLAGAIAAWRLSATSRRPLGLTSLAAAAVVLVTGMFGVVAQVVDSAQKSHVLLAAIERFDEQAEVGSLGGYEPSWVFYGRRPIQELYVVPKQVAATQAAPNHNDLNPPGNVQFTATTATTASPTATTAVVETRSPYAPKPMCEVASFLEANRHRVAIVSGRQMAVLQEQFGGRLIVLAEAPKFLRSESLFVVTLHEQVARRPDR